MVLVFRLLSLDPANPTGVAPNPGPGQGQWFAGGGGGGSYRYQIPQVHGGAGMCGDSGKNPGDNGVNGTTSTGGGGGGATGWTAPPKGGAGGSGIVVVRYQIGELTAQAKATGGAISFFGNKTIHTFTTSGDFNAPASISNVEYVCIGGGGAGGTELVVEVVLVDM